MTGLAYAYDLELLASLDAGCNIDEDLSAVADSYHMDWWNFDKHPSPSWVLGYGTIVDALEHHRQVTGIKAIMPVKMDKTMYTWNRNVSFVAEGIKLDCDRCRLYRGVSLGVLDNIQDLRHHVHGLEVTYEERADLAARRAAGFFQLYEAAQAKEASADNVREQGESNNRKGKQRENNKARVTEVEELAAAELKRLSNLPSLKWTWGADLTIDEVLQLHKRDYPFIPRKQHSGYNVSGTDMG